MSIDWRRKDSDRWIGRSSTHLLCVQRTSDRVRWSWKITPIGGGAVLSAGIAHDAEGAKKAAETALEERRATEVRNG